MRKNEEKAEVLSAVLASVFSSKTRCPQVARPELEEREKSRMNSKFQKMMLLCLSDTHTSTGLAGIHLRMLSKLLREPTEPRPTMYQQSWLFRQVPVGCTLGSIPPTNQQRGKEDLT